MGGFAGSSENRYRPGLFERIWVAFRELTEDKIRAPAETQRSGFGGKRRSSEMNEFSPIWVEARDMETAMT